MRIIQITDSHISIHNPQRTVDLENCIRAVNAVTPKPDLVVHTGDIAHDGLTVEYETAKSLLSQLSSPYVVLAGNRDNREHLMQVFADCINVDSDSKFLQYVVDSYSARLIVIDTVGQASKGTLCEVRLKHIDAMLAADAEKPVIVFMHHTPFEATEIPDPFQFEDWTDVDKLLQIFKNYSQIQAVYCGHIHRNVEAEVAGLSVSALSCLACDLRKGELSKEDAERPMFKVIDLP